MNVERGKIIEIERDAKTASIAPSTNCIGELACFNGSITTLQLENTQIISIEKSAFALCWDLIEISFPASLENICECAFSGCRNLKDIRFPINSQLKKIGIRAFRCCVELESFEFPPNLEEIEEYAFENCTKMKNFDLKNTKVEYLGNSALGSTRDIKAMLPATISLSSIKANSPYQLSIADNHPFCKKDNFFYNMSDKTIINGNKMTKHAIIRRGTEIIGNNCCNSSVLVRLTIPASVKEISDFSFYNCVKLETLNFSKNSRLTEIKQYAFSCCKSLKVLNFPKSLKIIRNYAFSNCCSLEKVIFPLDSQLEIIENAFPYTNIKRLFLPNSVREIDDVANSSLQSIQIFNDHFRTNEEETAIFSNDKKELISVLKSLDRFEIPEGTRVIKKNAFKCSIIKEKLFIPDSIEVIEEKAFESCSYLKVIEFSPNSRLKNLAFDSLSRLDDLIINNENFIKLENGVVMSMNPKGIVFVPKALKIIELDSDIEMIYSNAFKESLITNIRLPKSLKAIYNNAFESSLVKSVSFEEGTELEFFGVSSFMFTFLEMIKLPLVKKLENILIGSNVNTAEFPPNFDPSYISYFMIFQLVKHIIVPKSSLNFLTKIDFAEIRPKIDIIDG